MAEVSDTEGMLRQNLMDAGCSHEMAEQCVKLSEEQDAAQLLRVLARHRRTLLDAVHAGQKRIDCLDYLIYKIKKQAKSV